MPEIRITVDGRDYSVRPDEILLDALLANGVYVPHICHLESQMNTGSACRLCFVEIEGCALPVCACEIKVCDGMAVFTGTEHSRRLASRALRLLAERHQADCRDCARKATCPFREVARNLGIPFASLFEQSRIGESIRETNIGVQLAREKCILCGSCQRVCADVGYGFLGMSRRGSDTELVVAEEAYLNDVALCRDCHRCIDSCPVGALHANW